MEEEGEGKTYNFYGSFTFHVKLCFKRHVHWCDGWKKEGDSVEEEDLVKEKDVGILICSPLEPALALIGHTVNGREVIGIRVVKVECHDSPYIDAGISKLKDAEKEVVVEEDELKRLREEECMPSETQVESVVDSRDEEGADWSEAAEQGGLGEILASESSIDGMALAKIKRHSHDDDNLYTNKLIDDFEPMDLDEEVQDERWFSGLKRKQPLTGADDSGHRYKAI